MVTKATPYQTAQRYIGITTAAQRVRMPGMPQVFQTRAEMNAERDAERDAIERGAPVWINHTYLYNGEEPGVDRLWTADTTGVDAKARAANSHLRRFRIGVFSATLTSDAGRVIVGVGLPGAGNDGDYFWATDSGRIFLREADAWVLAAALKGGGGPGAPIPVGESRRLLPSDADGLVVCSNDPVFTIPVSGLYGGTFDGTCTFASEDPSQLTVLDARNTGAVYPSCSLMMRDATPGALRYVIYGSKA